MNSLVASTPSAAFLALLAGYLLGSLPFALWVSRLYGVDILKVGSGNPGMTNVWRTLGWKPALPVAILDIAKGGAATWAGGTITHSILWALLAGVAAVLGHSFSFWIGFRGGKSVLTAFGVFLYLAPIASLIAFIAWILVMAVTRWVSLSSILAALALPALIYAESPGSGFRSPVFWAAVPVCAFVVIRHRSNIGRLLKGTEPRFRGKSSAASGEASPKATSKEVA
jgi:glycerol-3-phosphate acyltransferase PlsY